MLRTPEQAGGLFYIAREGPLGRVIESGLYALFGYTRTDVLVKCERMTLMSTSVKAVPEGYQAVIPYLVVDHAEQVIEFIKQTFHAQELMRMSRPDGTIGHTELRIRDSVIMLGGASAEWKAMPCMLYLYLENVDEAYQRALAAGGVSLKEPSDQFYGDRTAAVTDMSGNQWWMATHTEEVSPEEIERRQKARA